MITWNSIKHTKHNKKVLTTRQQKRKINKLITTMVTFVLLALLLNATLEFSNLNELYAKDLIIENQLEAENAYIQDETTSSETTQNDAKVKASSTISTIAIGISPAIIELPVEPAKTKVTKVYVFNNTNAPLPIHAFADNFSVNEAFIDVSKDNIKTFDASNWLTIDPPDFILQPQEEKEVYISVSPDINAEPGGHYATVYFRPLISEEYITPDKTYLTAQIGVLMFFTIPGDIKEIADVSSITLPKYPTSNNFLPTILIENKGNIHIIPTGKITIKNILKGNILEFPIKSTIILPNTEKQISSETKSKLKFGLYRTYFTGSYGSQNKPLASSDKIFIVFPDRKILIAIFLIILTTIFIQKYYKNIPLAIKVLFAKIEDEDKSGRN